MLDQLIPYFAKFRSAASVATTALALTFSVIGAGGVILASQYKGQPVEKIILSSSLALVAILSLVWVAYRTFTSGRKEKYANITVKYRAIFDRMRDMTVELYNASQAQPYSADSLKLSVEKTTTVLDDLASIYSMLTGTRCRAALKVVNSDGEKVWVHTLARDRVSTEENRISDEDRANKKYDELNENEDFEHLFNKNRSDKGYYFNNNLMSSRSQNKYKSTSLLYHGENAASSSWSGGNARWPLDYRSTIVWPIRGKGLGVSPDETECIGFLCIDSESRGVFEERWDPHIGSAVASSFYMPLNFYSLIDNSLEGGGTNVEFKKD